jgi:hypothetical protein
MLQGRLREDDQIFAAEVFIAPLSPKDPQAVNTGMAS